MVANLLLIPLENSIILFKNVIEVFANMQLVVHLPLCVEMDKPEGECLVPLVEVLKLALHFFSLSTS